MEDQALGSFRHDPEGKWSAQEVSCASDARAGPEQRHGRFPRSLMLAELLSEIAAPSSAVSAWTRRGLYGEPV